MTRLEFFLAAMMAGMYRNKNWVVSAFAVIQEAPEAWRKDPYAYRIVQLPNGKFFVNPDNTAELIPLDNGVATPADVSISVTSLPPFTHNEPVQLKKGDTPNLFEDKLTTYGRVLANFIVLIWPFNDKIPYVEGRMRPRYLENLIIQKFSDDPLPVVEGTQAMNTVMASPDTIFVSEYLKFTNAMTYISGFADLWVSGGTRKTLLPPPGVKELRDSLIKKYNIDVTKPVDPAIVALIAKELQVLDTEWLKGDDTLNLLINKKNFDVIRAKKFLMLGAEAGLGDGVEVDLIPQSLTEGWDITKMPAMVNNLRAGSFNRGAETMRGGESVKWLLRASGNINILPTDCGSRLGRKITLTKDDRRKYLNFTIVSDAPGIANIKLTEEVFDSYIGKTVKMRSPMYCQLTHTDYCAVCVGPRLAENPTGASSAISDYGSTMLLMFMKANHGKALLLAKYDYKSRIV